MSMILAHAGHGHGPDWSLISLVAVAVVLAAWSIGAAGRARRRRSGSAAGRTAASPDAR